MDDPQVESTYLGTGQLISHRYVMNAKVPLVRTVAVLGGSYGGALMTQISERMDL